MAAPPSVPCGLSAVARNSSSCPACWLAVVAFPPRVAAVEAAFRRSCGTTRPSDSSRPFATLSFRSRWLPPAVARGGGREVSPGKNAELRADAVAYTCATRRKLGFAAVGRLTPWLARLISASLSLGSALHFRLPPDGPSRGRPCRFSDGFLPSRSQEDFHLQFRAHAGRTKLGRHCLHKLGAGTEKLAWALLQQMATWPRRGRGRRATAARAPAASTGQARRRWAPRGVRLDGVDASRGVRSATGDVVHPRGGAGIRSRGAPLPRRGQRPPLSALAFPHPSTPPARRRYPAGRWPGQAYT